MSNISLEIHNFGPLRKANIETRRYNFFIGRTSSGKSVVAKLITISHEYDFRSIADGDFASFEKMLSKYNIDFEFKEDTEINIKEGSIYWIIKKNSFKTNNDSENLRELQKTDYSALIKRLKSGKKGDPRLLKDLMDAFSIVMSDNVTEWNQLSKETQDSLQLFLFGALKGFVYDPVYIPSERILLSIMKDSVFSLLRFGGSIPESIVKFGSRYEQAKGKFKNLDMDFMNIRVSFSKEEDKIVILNDQTEVDFLHASSGLQSVIPLWTVLQSVFSQHLQHEHIVIEEPELNLFPTQQVALIRKIISGMNHQKCNIVFTTHSPYILSVIDNMILANEIYKKAKDKKDIQNKITNIVSKKEFIDFGEVASYGFNDDGTVDDIRDVESRLTGAINIDQASNETNRVFSRLLDIEDEL